VLLVLVPVQVPSAKQKKDIYKAVDNNIDKERFDGVQTKSFLSFLGVE
jgi:hypothetical protein